MLENKPDIEIAHRSLDRDEVLGVDSISTKISELIIHETVDLERWGRRVFCSDNFALIIEGEKFF